MHSLIVFSEFFAVLSLRNCCHALCHDDPARTIDPLHRICQGQHAIIEMPIKKQPSSPTKFLCLCHERHRSYMVFAAQSLRLVISSSSLRPLGPSVGRLIGRAGLQSAKTSFLAKVDAGRRLDSDLLDPAPFEGALKSLASYWQLPTTRKTGSSPADACPGRQCR